jgi:hypothetical protein
MQIGSGHDEALIEKAGHIAGLSFNPRKGFRIRQGTSKP